MTGTVRICTTPSAMTGTVRICTTPLNERGFIVRGWLNGAMLVTGKALPDGVLGSDEHLEQVLTIVKYLQRHRPTMTIVVDPFGGSL